MSRAQNISITALFDAAEVGGFTLPEELLAAHRTLLQAKAITVPTPPPVDTDAAAAQLVAALVAGEEPDPIAQAELLEERQRQRALAETATQVARIAAEQAADAMTHLAADLTERIITDHLRPALAKVWADAREVAANLNGYDITNHRALITAPTKVRNAYAKLPELVARDTAIRTARKKANSAGYREPQHDTQHAFATFAHPEALHPGWSAESTAAMPAIPFPKDPAERLLWIVTPEVAAAEPWLPTVAEQDAAWLAMYGEKARQKSPGWGHLITN